MIFWLASYPKSGNTWLRTLLTNYLREDGSPADINLLEGGPIASARVWFDEWVGIEASALSDAVVERLRPAVYRCMARDSAQPLWMKVHDAWSRTDRGEPLFPPEITAGVVYLLRNPLDLATSLAHHFGVTQAAAVERLCDSGFSLARSVDGLRDQLRQRLGSWTDHVSSWVDDSDLPLLLIRYEDLKLKPVETFGRVVKFGSLAWDPERLRKAVQYSDFVRLREQEQAVGFDERPALASAPFFRRGEAGAWREELPQELVDRLLRVHGEFMARFGYLDGKGNPL